MRQVKNTSLDTPLRRAQTRAATTCADATTRGCRCSRENNYKIPDLDSCVCIRFRAYEPCLLLPQSSGRSSVTPVGRESPHVSARYRCYREGNSASTVTATAFGKEG